MRLVLRPDGAPSILGLLLLSERAALTAFLRGRPCGKRSGHAMASADYFPSRPKGPLYIARQNSRLPPSSAALRPLSLRSAVQVRSARRLSSP